PTTNPIVGTYGQYQDLKFGAWDLSVHFHEGLDIAASVFQPNEQVRAVTTGTVVALIRPLDRNNNGSFNDPGDIPPYNTGVVVRDRDANGNYRKWLYLHVWPSSTLHVGNTVIEGQTVIGTVGDVIPAFTGYPNHVHLGLGFGLENDPLGLQAGWTAFPVE